MSTAFRIIAAIAFASVISPAIAAGPPNKDPDWPCQQLKVMDFPLASVWAGPELDLNAQAWRNESDVADLAAKMSQRRVPVEEVESAIAAFKAKEGPEAKDKLLRAFAAAFGDLTQQRSRVLEGLERFGRRQREMGDRIRTENEALRKAVDVNHGQPGADDAALQQKLDWDVRVFSDRQQTVSYVCEAPSDIEHRIGVIARAVQQAL